MPKRKVGLFSFSNRREKEMELTKVQPINQNLDEQNEDFNRIVANQWPFTRNMFVNKQDMRYSSEIYEDDNKNDTDILFESNHPRNRSTYRTSYPYDQKSSHTESSFLKSLEGIIIFIFCDKYCKL